MQREGSLCTAGLELSRASFFSLLPLLPSAHILQLAVQASLSDVCAAAGRQQEPQQDFQQQHHQQHHHQHHQHHQQALTLLAGIEKPVVAFIAAAVVPVIF